MEDDEYKYDGNEHFNAKTANSTAKSGTTTYSYSFEESGTYVTDLTSLTKVDAGEYTIYVKGTNPNYSAEATTTAKLTITKRSVNLTSEGGSKPYDGKPLTKPNVTVGGDGFVTGEVSDIKATGSVTTVAEGEVTNTITYKEGANFKADNYTITKSEGKLKITKVNVTLTSGDASKTYDGSALTNADVEGKNENGLTVETGWADGEGATYTFTGSQTLVGSKANAFTVTAKDGTDLNNYNIIKTEGMLTVTDEKVPDEKVVVKTDSNTGKTYHIGDTVTWNIWVKNIYDENKRVVVDDELNGVTLSDYPATLAPGQEINVTATYVVTADDVEKGTIKNEVTIKLGDLEKHGDDTVKTEPTEITITADSAKKVYDGTALTKNSAKVTKGTLASGDKIGSITVTGSQTLVGESDNVPSNAKIVNAKNEDVTKAYIIKYANGKLKVTDGTNPDDPTPVPDDKVVTKTDANTGTRYYEGDTVTWNIWVKNIYDEEKSLTVTENLAGVTLEPAPPATAIPATLGAGVDITLIAKYTVTAADVEAGRVTNTVRVKLGDLEKNGNDTVITQTPVIVTISGFQITRTYDGQVHSIEGFEAISNNDEYNKGMNEEIGIDSNITFSGGDGVLASAVNVEDSPQSVDLSTIRFENINPNFPKVEFVFNPANHHNTVIINPAPVTITTGNASKDYDGTALTENEASINGLVNNETAIVTATGSQTEVGSSVNTYSIEWVTANRNNYTVIENLGTLTVLAAEIIEEDETPKTAPEEEIEDDETPLAAPTWALINLIASILTVVTAAGMIITYFKKKEDDEEANEDGTVRQLTDEEKQAEEEENERKKSKFLGLIPGIGSVITFLLTEDMRNQMVLTDKWTILMLAILVIGAAMAYLTRNQKDEEEEQSEET